LLVRSKMRWGSLTPSSGTDRSRKVHWGDDESRSVPSAFKGTKKEYGVVFLMKPGGCASGFSRPDGCMLFAPLPGMCGYFRSNACQTVRSVIHGLFTGYPEWSQVLWSVVRTGAWRGRLQGPAAQGMRHCQPGPAQNLR